MDNYQQVWVNGSCFACLICGALVSVSYRDLHSEFHDNNESKPKVGGSKEKTE